MVVYLYKLESPSFNDALCQAWLNLAQWFWRGRFLNLVNVFSLFYYYLSLKIGIALHLNKFESPSPRDALCQVWVKLAKWFWRRRFLNFVNVLLLFRKYLHLEMGMALHLTKLESPSHHDAFCQVLLKLAQWFFKFCQCIFAIS